jgi:hypothetical protein
MSLTSSETPQREESEQIHKRRSSGSRARRTARPPANGSVVKVRRH